MKRMLVVGGGVAGAAAAHHAALRGVHVVWIRGGVGASSLASGAADLRPWTRAPEREPLSNELSRFVDALDAWTIDVQSARVATVAGVLRCARARDPLVLDIARLGGGHVWVVDGDEEKARDRALSLSSFSWCRQSRTTFHPLAYPSPRGRVSEPRELAAVAKRAIDESNRAEKESVGWLFTPELLSSEADCERLQATLGGSVGTTLGEAGSVLGRRLHQKLLDFAPAGVERVQGWVSILASSGARLNATLKGEDAASPGSFDGAVVAIGGAAVGGIVLTAKGRLQTSMEVPGGRIEVPGPDGTWLDADVGSRQGVNFFELAVDAPSRLGLASDGRTAPNLVAAGDCVAGSDRTLLGAAQSGIDAAAFVLLAWDREAGSTSVSA